jgi:hypothetical protein
VIAPAGLVGQVLAIAYLAIATLGFTLQSALTANWGSILKKASEPFALPVAALLWAYDINN